jgi:hypothetical protein
VAAVEGLLAAEEKPGNILADIGDRFIVTEVLGYAFFE